MTPEVKTDRFNYIAKYKSNQLIYGNGNTVVVTGWTVKEALCKRLQPSEYAVIGQLYSPTRGINILVRNLLLNPHVHYLIVINATKEDKNAGAIECLLDFFAYGVEENFSDSGRKSWVICSPIPGYIDIEVDIKALEKLRHSIEVATAKSISVAIEKIQFYAQKPILPPWGMRLEFSMSKFETPILPGVIYGHRIEGKTIAETWVKIMHRIKTTGKIRPSAYDSKWQELIDLMAIITHEPEDFYFPDPNYLPIDRTYLPEYISQVLDDAPEREGVKYTYGQRLRSWFGKDQIQQVIDKLTNDLDSARAVMSLWDPKQDHHDSPPCLNHIWVRIVDNQLSLTATFRSNDMFSAWPANAMGLRALQKYIYDRVHDRVNNKTNQNFYGQLQLGPLITISQSAHIYDECWESAENVIASHYRKISQEKDYFDPAGNFIIYVQDGNIIVEHTTPNSGEVINCYSGKSAVQLSREIIFSSPGLQVDHAMYLGSELQKAEMALSSQQGLIYEQDKPLKTNS
jgi:thymidylate synthase